MALEVIRGGRMYFPPEDENDPDNRDVMHPETDETQIYMKTGLTLAETVQGSVIISEENPMQKCIWAKIKRVEDPNLEED